MQGAAGRVPVLLDGGVRRGTDVITAIALGARAVLVGRPVLWGLAVDGRAGVATALGLLRRELDVAMALCGCPNIAAITRPGDAVIIIGTVVIVSHDRGSASRRSQVVAAAAPEKLAGTARTSRRTRAAGRPATGIRAGAAQLAQLRVQRRRTVGRPRVR